MCQIIHKVKDYSLPFNLLDSTCITNPDGFGIMMFDGKKVIADKVWTGEDNDPEKIAKFLETIHSEEAFLHFRYKTKGVVSTESCHPFKIYDANDREVYLMHNGTFSEYGSATKVDSEEFGEEVVAPLYDTFLKSGERNPLHNEFFHQILHKFSGAGSKVVLMDNTGKYSIVNQKAGEMFQDKLTETKFWVSNTYSFNKQHRTGGGSGWTSNFRSKTYGGSSESDSPFSATTEKEAANLPAVTGKQTSVPSTHGGGGIKKEAGSIPKRTVLKNYWKDILKLDNIDDLLDMTNEDIGELVDIEPENAKLLIKDLIFELYCCMYTRDSVEDEDEIENPVVAIN